MILSDRDIKIALKNKEIIVNPKPNLKEQLGSSSLDSDFSKIANRHSLIRLIQKQQKV
jgi:deoxycytidine triphosphate deaminase